MFSSLVILYLVTAEIKRVILYRHAGPPSDKKRGTKKATRHRSQKDHRTTATMTNTRSKGAAEGGKKTRSGGRPPLPVGGKGGKKKAAKKAPKAAVAAAKKAVVDEQVAVECPVAVVVKTEAPAPPKRRVFTEEEDACLCKAWVNTSEDPVTGAGQKKDDFWSRVHQKCLLICSEDMEVQPADPWSVRSVQDRFTKLEKDVRRFNVYYAQIAREKDKSGWTPEMIITAVKTLYESQEGRPYKNHLITRILHQSPKCSPLHQDQENDNHMAVSQGRELEKPIGNKKAKKMKLIEKLGEDSAAAGAQTEALMSVAASANGLVTQLSRKRKTDSMHKQVDSYIKLGMTQKALELLEQIQSMEASIEDEENKKKAATDVPKNIDVDDHQEEGDDSAEEEEEFTQQQGTGPHFRSAVDDALDDGDDGGDTDEDSDHPSQPSDDSKAMKRVPV